MMTLWPQEYRIEFVYKQNCTYSYIIKILFFCQWKLNHENDMDFEHLLLHTAVRWLSKGNCLCRLFELFDTVTEFLHMSDLVLRENLKQCKLKFVYFCVSILKK